MRAFDYTSEQTTAYEALWDLDARANTKGVSGDYIGIDSKKALGPSNHDHLLVDLVEAHWRSAIS
jgi:hypothetical protein